MPSNLNPLGALPSRFRRQRVLIVGCGDVGLRVARQLPRHVRLIALTSSAERVPELRAQRITPLQGNLDNGASLRRLAGLATRVVHLAPPPNDNPAWRSDPRTLALLRALRLRSLPQSLV
ncbi:MAG TPA: NAD-binding protein, partial [Polaromonas sp.]